MKKIRKYLRFEKLKLVLENQHPKEISRVNFHLIEENQQAMHTTKTYGEVTPTTITWKQGIQFPYTNQESLKFQTVCEHQYGYQIQQLKALYNGSIYIKTQNFFQDLSAHVFSQEGEKCGIFRYMIKVVQKQEGTAQSKPKNEPVVQQVKIDLRGKITLYAANFKTTSVSFHASKYQSPKLRVQYGQLIINSDQKNDYKWSFPSQKIEVLEDNQYDMQFIISNDNQIILKGSLSIDTLQKNKRFLTQQIIMHDLSDQKIGILQLDIRFLNKKQYLDLLYSPKQLSDSKPHQKGKRPVKSSRVQMKKSDKQPSPQLSHPMKMSQKVGMGRSQQQLSRLLHKKDKTKYNDSSFDLRDELRPNDRYKKVHMINGFSENIIPKAKRFSENKYVNPYVSYIDPGKISDFSPSRYKGPNISSSKKTDFTRPYKNNPGVGQYKLPSIWEKY